MRKLPMVATVLFASLALAGGVVEDARAQDNAAVAVNLRDGASVFRFAFKVARVNQDVVDESNAAVAFASCTECETVALAFQVVLIFSDPDVVATENVALALNYECDACQTLASAYQFVLTTGGPVHFTAEGNRRIAEIRLALRELLRSDVELTELQTAVDALADELRAVVRAELVPAGEAGADGTDDETTETEPAETTETETTETDTTETETTGTTTSTP